MGANVFNPFRGGVMAWEFVVDTVPSVEGGGAGWIDKTAARGWSEAAIRAAANEPRTVREAEAQWNEVRGLLANVAGAMDTRGWFPALRDGPQTRWARGDRDREYLQLRVGRQRQLSEWVRQAVAAGQPGFGPEPHHVRRDFNDPWLVTGWNPRTQQVVDYASDPEAIRWAWVDSGEGGPVQFIAPPQQWAIDDFRNDVGHWLRIARMTQRDPAAGRRLWRIWRREENDARARSLGLAGEQALELWSAAADLRNSEMQALGREANAKAAADLAQMFAATGVLAPIGAVLAILGPLLRAIPAATAVDVGPFGLPTFRSGGPLERTRPVHVVPVAPVPLLTLGATQFADTAVTTLRGAPRSELSGLQGLLQPLSSGASSVDPVGVIQESEQKNRVYYAVAGVGLLLVALVFGRKKGKR